MQTPKNNFDPTKAIEGTENPEAAKNAKGRLETGEVAQAKEKATATTGFAKQKLDLTQEALYGQEGSLAQLQSPPLAPKQEREMAEKLKGIEENYEEVDAKGKEQAKNEVKYLATTKLGLVDEDGVNGNDIDQTASNGLNSAQA